jgi:hypothetical protein
MASILKQAELLQVQIESYIQKIATCIPAVKGDEELLSFLSPTLSQDKTRNKNLRRAFGFPAKLDTSATLLQLLSSSEPSLRPLISVCAQRMYHFLWRLKSTVQEIDAVWREEVLPKIDAAVRLCEPHLMAKWPTLLDLSGPLKFKADFSQIVESAADPTLFAVLRAFDYHDENQPLLAHEDELKQLRISALDFLFDYLQDVLSMKRPVDDSSNLWWALRVGICSGDGRYLNLIGLIAARFSKIVVPTLTVQGRSVVPEIYRDVRTASYTLSNIQAILEAGVEIDETTLDQLKKIIQLMIKLLLDVPFSKNLYLASVHHEGIGNYLDYSRDLVFASKIQHNVLTLADSSPVVDYACGDVGLEEQILDVRHWLEKGPPKRNALLIYGASSTGKSFLVEKLFKQFQQEGHYEDSRIICRPGLDVPSELTKLAERIHARASKKFPPFIFIDEIDVEFSSSIYPHLLTLLDKGSVPNFTGVLERFVLFWGGGKFGSVEYFKKFLDKNQKSSKFEKGTDFFNRTKKRIELPFSLYRNKNHKILVGVSEIARAFGLPVQIDRSVLTKLKRLPAERGAREFGPFVESLIKDGNVVVAPSTPATGILLNVQ